MKITGIDTLVCEAGLRNWVFIKVSTDQPGLIGWGEATLEWKTRAVVGAVADIAPLVVGHDPRDIEQAYQRMTRHGFWRLGVEGMSAISAIEIALWDILGKSLDQPVWRLLGGKTRDYLRTYSHLGMGDQTAVYNSTSAETVTAHAKALVEKGYDALKIVSVPYTHYHADAKSLRGFERLMDELRDAVGPDIDIMVDFHGRPASVSAARAYIRLLEPHRVMFAEEPVPPENVDDYISLATEARVPIAGGERLVGRREFKDMFQAKALHIAQPDIVHTGGLWETRKIAAMAEAAGIGLAPHNPLGPIAGVAALHLGIATPNIIIQEEMTGAVPWYDEVVQWPIERKPGRWDLPTRPGLGIEVNEKAIAEHPHRQEPMSATDAVAADGTILDW